MTGGVASALVVIESVVRKLQEKRRARGKSMGVARILRIGLFSDGTVRYNTVNWVQGPGRGRDVARLIHPFALPLSPLLLEVFRAARGRPDGGSH